jgi:hypothetical protein
VPGERVRRVCEECEQEFSAAGLNSAARFCSPGCAWKSLSSYGWRLILAALVLLLISAAIAGAVLWFSILRIPHE